MTSTSLMLITFGGDTTFRWACREGDFMLWLRLKHMLSEEWAILDFWRLRDGDAIVLTNRLADLPHWFELHYSEICNALGEQVMKEYEAGTRRLAEEPADGPNLWRIRAGDRIVWTGTPRPGNPGCDGILAVIEFRASVLIAGEPAAGSLREWVDFGGPPEDLDKQEISLCRHGYDVAVGLGEPCVFGVEWLLGDGSASDTRIEELMVN